VNSRPYSAAEVSAGVLVSSDGGGTWLARGALRDAAAPGAADGWAVGTRTTPLVDHSVAGPHNRLLRDNQCVEWVKHDTAQTKLETATSVRPRWAVELPGGAIVLYCRTTTGFVYTTRSDDLGRTWTEPGPVDALKVGPGR